MKILALEREKPGLTAADFQPHLKAEARRVWELQQADVIRETHLQSIKDGKHNPLSGLTFSDIVVALRRIKNHSLNIAEAFTGGKIHN